jgi:hypothetical protein
MGKRILIVITIVLVTALLAGWYYFTREAKYFGTPAFRAVPENVSVIIRVHHLGNYTARSLDNPIWKAYSGFPGVSALYQQLGLADSLFRRYPEVKNTFIDKDLTIMFDGDNDHSGNLCIIELSSLTEKRALSGLVDDFFSRKGALTEKVKAGGTELSCYSWKEKELLHNYTITFYRGLFLAGSDREMVIKAVNRLETPLAPGSSVFEKASKTATDNIDLNIYLNHKRLPQFSHRIFSENFWKRMKGSSPLAEWSEIDLTQKNNELLFNGFSFTSDSLNNYLGIFLHQRPDSFKLAGLLPAETSFFLSFIINNSTQFFRDYENLLKSKNQLDQYRNSINAINSFYGVDLQKIVAVQIEGPAAMVFTRPDTIMPDENKFLVLRVRSGSEMERAMIPLTKASGSSKFDLSKNFSLYKIDKETIFKIYKTPVNDFGSRVFGEVFADVVTNYFTIYDNCLIMGASYESLSRFLRANVLQETLGNSQAYHAFISDLSDRMNFILWSSPGRSLPFFKETLNAGIYQSIEKQIRGFQKVESVAWQINIENGMVYNMAGLKYNPEEVHESPASIVWKSHLDSPVINQPQFVINPSDKAHREIVVQDSSHNFILMSNAGRVVWKIKLRGPIRSEIFQLDYFRNGKIQYFFSTDEALHLIDHEGNYLQNYPIALRSEATNGVSVADYDHNKDYRFFIACKDHKVYLYDRKGKIVAGWVPQKTEHDVIQPVQFFRVDNKDYIVFADKNRSYILDRKGKQRVIIKADIDYSRNRFTLEPASGKRQARLVTTDAKGTVLMIGFDGSVRRLSMGDFSADHFFIYDDLNADNKREYIFSDGDSLFVFDQSAKQIFSHSFKNSISLPPELYTFPDKSRKIGIADCAENRIYLFNADGTVCEGFPLEGNSRFALGFSATGQFSLITGTSDGYLNNYQIK